MSDEAHREGGKRIASQGYAGTANERNLMILGWTFSCAHRYRFKTHDNTKFAAICLGAALLIGGVALAQMPKNNISAARHPNLAARARLSQQAYEKIVAAQQANEWDMQGHAQKAKELLDQVNNELRQAATAANKAK